MAEKLLKKDIWVIIPGLNEEKYISTVLKKVSKQTSNIIVVDDGSTDAMPKLSKKYTPHVLVHSINLGKGAALKTGCKYAFGQLKAKAVVIMDADDQHNPEELPLFFKALKKHEVVFGVRAFDTGMPLMRIIGNRIASLVIYLFFGRYIPDIPSGFKAFSKKAYQQIKWESNDYAVEMEIAARTAKSKLAFKTIHIETIYHDFERGMTFLDTLRMLSNIITWKFTL